MIKSNLKEILDNKEISIRELARKADVRYESLRQLYHDEMERYPRHLIANVCRVLNIDVSDLFTLKK